MLSLLFVNWVNVPVAYQHWHPELRTGVDVWVESEARRGGLWETPQQPSLTLYPVAGSGLKAVQCNWSFLPGLPALAPCAQPGSGTLFTWYSSFKLLPSPLGATLSCNKWLFPPCSDLDLKEHRHPEEYILNSTT